MVALAFSQGGESNASGKFLERIVEGEARDRGFHVVEFNSNIGNSDLFAPKLLVRNVPYTSIYGSHSTSEFLIRHDVFDRRIRVECRWQQIAGSVDEKFPYLFWNARDAMPEQEIVLLIGGDGARDSAVKWLRAQCRRVSHKTIHVHTIPDFRHWFRRFAGGEA